MISLQASLTMARKALQAQQVAIQTTGHNIANANTPGFTRQRVDLSPSISFPLVATGSLGTGVNVKDISRIRDLLLDSQYRDAHQALSRQEAEEATLSQIELIVGEPSDNGLSAGLSALFASFQDLANYPTDFAVRSVVRDKARAVADQFHRLDEGFERLKIDLYNEIQVVVKQVNGLAQQIADLNRQIAMSEGGVGEANDLRDQRDQALDELSGLVGGSLVEDIAGQVRVTVGGGLTLVDGLTAVAVQAQDFDQTDPDYPDSVRLFLGGHLLTPGGGRLAGLLNSRNSTSSFVKGVQSQLDALAKALIDEVNTVHAAGFGLDGISGRNLFTPLLTTAGAARFISVDAAIEADVMTIAASSNADPGDNSTAVTLAGLQDDSTVVMLPSGQSVTFGGYLSGLVSDLAEQEAGAKRSVSLHTGMEDFLIGRRDQASGVSLDEEMTNLIRFQKAYEAAAHFANVVNDLLGTLMNQLGR
ncbi:MAG: flagellar hook-associated protein FlgK [Candidatus Methylomirabilota bacterium]|nr:flagellar hook-associated protein FlgK [candidate division NC10 bacterium]PWB43522.1 MAG: flagellar hook-associated protein FlgK [candidate division NC10 bacterium]